MSPRPSEDALIARYLAPLAGPGGLGLRDDAGLATPRPGFDLVVTKDMLVAGVHFFPDDPPGAIARKALRVNLSDLAAKGAVPLGFLLGLALPRDWTEAWLAAFVAGLGDDARAYGCPLIGGDTVAMPGPLTLSITAFGEVPAGRMVPRTGARAGDHLYVTGTIGDAALGLAVRRASPSDAVWVSAIGATAADALCERYLLPRPRVALSQAVLAHASAAMDVSDGLVGDLGKMLDTANLSATIAIADVPLSAAARAALAAHPTLRDSVLTGGDDYELLCAIPADATDAFVDDAHVAGVLLTRIGTCRDGARPPRFIDEAGRTTQFATSRFSHF